MNRDRFPDAIAHRDVHVGPRVRSGTIIKISAIIANMTVATFVDKVKDFPAKEALKGDDVLKRGHKRDI